MKLKIKISIAVAICLIALGVVIDVLNINVIYPVLSGIFAAGISLLSTSLYRHFKFGEGVEHDERTKKLMYRAFTGSWFAILFLITIIVLADQLGAFKMNVQGALSTILLSMIATFSGFAWYFGRKGDA